MESDTLLRWCPCAKLTRRGVQRSTPQHNIAQYNSRNIDTLGS